MEGYSYPSELASWQNYQSTGDQAQQQREEATEPVPGEFGSQSNVSLPCGVSNQPFSSVSPDGIPAMEYNGYTLHASSRHIPEELIRIPSGGSIAEPDSVLDEENGRTYHNHRSSRYFLPNDAAEQDRLDLQHKICMLSTNGALYKAPVRSPKYVLDIATGTGIWACQFARTHPESVVIGTDLSQIQPLTTPANVSFVKENSEYDDWMFPCQFDYVHLRAVLTCFDDHRTVMRKAYDSLNPGGWIEFHDPCFDCLCTDGTTDGSNIERYFDLLNKAGLAAGRDFHMPKRYKQCLIDTGFVDVVEETSPLPGNPWPSEPKFQELGHWQLANTLRGLRGLCWKLFRQMGMTPEEIEEIVRLAIEDCQDTRLHFFYPIYIVYGRKPYPGESVDGKGIIIQT